MKRLSSTLFPKVSLFLAIVFTAFLCLGAPSVSDDFTNRRIMAGAKIFRALLAADRNITKKKDQTGRLHIYLVYDRDLSNAQLAEKTLDIRKDTRIREIEIHIEVIRNSAFTKSHHDTIAGLFLTEPLRKKEITFLVNYAKNHRIIIFSPFQGDVERGVLGGISVEAHVRPYLNMKSINESNIRLKSFFLRVAKLYEQ